MTPSIQSTLTQLRDQAGYYCGDQRAEKILEKLVADTLRPVRAALNGDLQPTKDEETLAREMYHELVDSKKALAVESDWVTGLTKDNGILIEAASKDKAGAKCIELAGRLEKLEHDLASALFACAGWRKKAEELQAK